MITFEDFIRSYPVCKSAKDSDVAKHIYALAWEEKRRIRMTEYAIAGKAPLGVLAEEATRVSRMKGSDFDLLSRNNRNIVGLMVMASLRELGFLPAGRARIDCKIQSPFTTGRTFRFDQDYPAAEVIIKRIVPKEDASIYEC